eukprot:TRINITY_DN43629_c0_g1_i1.p1 TRINITY_DN43629_c0_g1~~TRINITY_DN43629_c0_g1_i1.p1  ORF type:complete len:1256 (-),score=208.80 TRINITY_DN43629_c0_g1_i1:64-3732(-)
MACRGVSSTALVDRWRPLDRKSQFGFATSSGEDASGHLRKTTAVRSLPYLPHLTTGAFGSQQPLRKGSRSTVALPTLLRWHQDEPIKAVARGFSKQSVSKRSTWQATSDRHMMRRPVSLFDQKLSAQAALAADHEYVQQALKKSAECPSDREARERTLADHWWSTTFAPVPSPRDWIPTVFRGHRLLQPPLAPSSAPGSASSSCRPSSSTSTVTAASGSWERSVLRSEDAEDIVRLCSRFHALDTHHGPDCDGQDGGTPAVLTRSSFCRLVCALRGLPAACGGRTWLNRAVGHFDRLARRICMKSCSCFGETIVGFTLAVTSKGPLPVDMAICRLFTCLLLDMADDLDDDQRGGGETEGHSFASMTEHDSLLVRTSMAKRRFFNKLLPEAERYALVCHEALQPKKATASSSRAPVATTEDMSHKDGASASGSDTHHGGGSSSASGSTSGTAGAPGGDPRSLGIDGFAASSRCVTPPTTGNGARRSRELSADVVDAVGMVAGVMSVGGGTSVPLGASTFATPLGALFEADEDTDICPGETGCSEMPLYAHTFSPMRAECLMSKSMEPEVLQLLVCLRDLFGPLFRAYCDVPVGCDAVPVSSCSASASAAAPAPANAAAVAETSINEGHMTLVAFLRFCGDFGLFPDRVDFQTIQWVYNSAEARVSMSDNAVDGSAARRSKASPSSPNTRVSSSPCGSSRHAISPGHTVKVTPGSIGETGPSVKNVAVGAGRDGAAIRQQRTRPDMNTDEAQQGIHFMGRRIEAHLVWLTKDVGTMYEAEFTSVSLLWAMSEWIESQKSTVGDVFAIFDLDNTGKISVKDFQSGIDFMGFEDPPSVENVRELAGRLSAPACREEETIELGTLQRALTAVTKQRERRDRVANCFRRDLSKLSQAESHAFIFFREILKFTEDTNTSAEQLFERFAVDAKGKDDDGAIPVAELASLARGLFRLQLHPSPALAVDSPIEWLDLNGDGMISREEFCKMIDQMRQARREREIGVKGRHPVHYSAIASRSAGPVKCVFGRVAFVECLLKLAFVNCGYHKNSDQVEQSSFRQVLWMFSYLWWQFDNAKQSGALDAKAHQDGQRDLAAAERRYPKYVPPLQRLLRHHANIFKSVACGRELLCSASVSPASSRPLVSPKLLHMLPSALSPLASQHGAPAEGDMLLCQSCGIRPPKTRCITTCAECDKADDLVFACLQRTGDALAAHGVASLGCSLLTAAIGGCT